MKIRKLILIWLGSFLCTCVMAQNYNVNKVSTLEQEFLVLSYPSTSYSASGAIVDSFPAIYNDSCVVYGKSLEDFPSFQYLWIFDSNIFSTKKPFLKTSGLNDSLRAVLTADLYDGPPPPQAIIQPIVNELTVDHYFNGNGPELTDNQIDKINYQGSSSLDLGIITDSLTTYHVDSLQPLVIKYNTDSVDGLHILYNSIYRDGVLFVDDNFRIDTANVIFGNVNDSRIMDISGYNSSFRNLLQLDLKGSQSLTGVDSLVVYFDVSDLEGSSDDYEEGLYHDIVVSSISNSDTIYSGDNFGVDDQLLSNWIEARKIRLSIVGSHDPNLLVIESCDCKNSDSNYTIHGRVQFTNDGKYPEKDSIGFKIPLPDNYIPETYQRKNVNVPGFVLDKDTVENGFIIFKFEPPSNRNSVNWNGFMPYDHFRNYPVANIEWTYDVDVDHPCKIPPVQGITTFGIKDYQTNLSPVRVVAHDSTSELDPCVDVEVCYCKSLVWIYAWIYKLLGYCCCDHY